MHPEHKLAHYARACTDVMFTFPFGTQELQGCAARGNYDLTQHATVSGKSMEYFDEERKEKYVPHVIEPSIGVDRLMLAVLTSAYAEVSTASIRRSTPIDGSMTCGTYFSLRSSSKYSIDLPLTVACCVRS